ncbi:hypothetical protein O1611_g5695 [Lasiodiplodia mahajangana]|uniref:Uncharacterized protein n=1 Tax=Lasiodiplodia mahajangana TaxID=1108764 RepID=A0ACC2JK90_9PEZI|nr:hypothetical protein O1611_g5695 [Lasiodiplodia mahajangana]
MTAPGHGYSAQHGPDGSTAYLPVDSSNSRNKSPALLMHAGFGALTSPTMPERDKASDPDHHTICDFAASRTTRARILQCHWLACPFHPWGWYGKVTRNPTLESFNTIR